MYCVLHSIVVICLVVLLTNQSLTLEDKFTLDHLPIFQENKAEKGILTFLGRDDHRVSSCALQTIGDCSIDKDCVILGTCCAQQLNTKWPVFYAFSTKSQVRCVPLITGIASSGSQHIYPENITYDFLAVIVGCDAPPLYVTNYEQLRDRCHLYGDEGHHVLDSDSGRIYANQYCAECHGITHFTVIPSYRFCGEDIRESLGDNGVPLMNRLKLYYENCTRIFNTGVLQEALPESKTRGRKLAEKLVRCKGDFPRPSSLSNLQPPVIDNNLPSLLAWLCRASSNSMNCQESRRSVFCNFQQNFTSCLSCRPSMRLGKPQNPDLHSTNIPSFAVMIDFRKVENPFVPRSSNSVKEVRICSPDVSDMAIETESNTLAEDALCRKTVCLNGMIYNPDIDQCVDPRNALNISLFASNLKSDTLSEICGEFKADGFQMSLNSWCNVLFLAILDKQVSSKTIHLHVKRKSPRYELLAFFSNNKLKNNIFNILIKDMDTLDQVNIEKMIIENSYNAFKSTELSNENAIPNIARRVEWVIGTNNTGQEMQENAKTFITYPSCIQVTYINASPNLNMAAVMEIFSKEKNIPTNGITFSDTYIYVLYCNKNETGHVTRSTNYHEGVNDLVTKIITPLSMTALFLTLAVYVALPQLRTQPGICVMHLIACLFLNYLFFFSLALAGGKSRLGIGWCFIGAALNHYVALGVFTWSLCISYTTKNTFGSPSRLLVTSSSIGSKNSHTVCGPLIWLNLFAYGTPALAVVFTLASSIWCYNNRYCFHDTSNSKNQTTVPTMHYLSRESNLCWLGSGFSTLLGMTLPAVSLMLATGVLYLQTLIGLCRIVRQTENVVARPGVPNNSTVSSRKRVILLLVPMKLGILLGFVWVFPGINIWIRSVGVDIFGNFLVASQGLFISIAFLCNSRVAGFLRDKFIASHKHGSGSVYATKLSVIEKEKRNK